MLPPLDRQEISRQAPILPVHGLASTFRDYAPGMAPDTDVPHRPILGVSHTQQDSGLLPS